MGFDVEKLSSAKLGDGTARQKKARKTKEEVHGCSKRRYGSLGSSRKGHTGPSQMEKQNPLWRPLKLREKPKEEEEEEEN